MEHVHYDLDKIEADIRAMYKAAPADAFDNNKAASEAIRRSVGVEVAMSRWFFTEVMSGSPPDVTMTALEGVMVNLIANRMASFYPNEEDGAHPIFEFVSRVATGSIVAFKFRDEDMTSSCSTLVEPVASGRA